MTPRLGFLGVGWIGRNRLDAVRAAGVAEVAAVADADAEVAAGVAEALRTAVVSPGELLGAGLDLDGVVIATPSALHAEQSAAALARGRAVFCQKPLARTAAETRRVVEAAEAADRLLAVDLSYRQLTAVRRIRELLAGGELGEVYAADLAFHNAYGPDKPWFTDPARSGGGCVIDLGIHLVDLVLWLLEGAKVEAVTSRLWAGGRALGPAPQVCEDHAIARLDLSTGAAVSLACSWWLDAGVDAEIAMTLHGTKASVAMHNVGGSFYDFRADLLTGTTRREIAVPPDDWGGRAIVDWAVRLGAGQRFDPSVWELVDVADVLDRVYGR